METKQSWKALEHPTFVDTKQHTASSPPYNYSTTARNLTTACPTRHCRPDTSPAPYRPTASPHALAVFLAPCRARVPGTLRHHIPCLAPATASVRLALVLEPHLPASERPTSDLNRTLVLSADCSM